MSRIIMGSSNMSRFYPNKKFHQYGKYEMAKTCNYEVFKARMTILDENCKIVIIQVIENLLEDAVKANVAVDGTIQTDALINTITGAIRIVMDNVKTSAMALPGTNYFMVMPITRPAVAWYTDNFETIYKDYGEKVDAMNLPNVKKLECFALEAQKFDSGLVHLTRESGDLFIGAILSGVDELCGVVRMDEELSTPLVTSQKTGTTHVRSDQERLMDLEKRVGMVEKKGEEDNLAFARNREEMDTLVNKEKEDRIIITGLTNSIPMPLEAGAKKLWLENMVLGVLKRLDPEGSGKLLFIKLGKGDGRNIPVAEVRMESKETARRIRAAYVTAKNAKMDLGRLFVANSVTLATRVRCDILKAIALKINKPEIEEVYVTPFSSRPVLHIKDIKRGKQPYALTFSDAIARYGSVLEEGDLEEAYRRAGNTFNRQMKQTFVVLKEESDIRTTVLANRGRGGYAPRSRGAPYRGRGSIGQQGRGGGNPDQRGQKRVNDDYNNSGGGYGMGGKRATK